MDDANIFLSKHFKICYKYDYAEDWYGTSNGIKYAMFEILGANPYDHVPVPKKGIKGKFMTVAFYDEITVKFGNVKYVIANRIEENNKIIYKGVSKPILMALNNDEKFERIDDSDDSEDKSASDEDDTGSDSDKDNSENSDDYCSDTECQLCTIKLKEML